MPSIKGLLNATIALVANSSGLNGIFYHGGDIAPCGSPLYCYGPVLEEIQLAKPFVDSKTYVDM